MKTLLQFSETSSDSLKYLLVAIVIFLALFLLLREVMLWYWKVNTIIKTQKGILFLLNKIYEGNGGILNEEERKEIDRIIKS